MNSVPQERISIGSNEDIEHLFDRHEAIKRAVGELVSHRLILLNNESVYAIVGNANSPTLLEDIRVLKNDPHRTTVGWTVPYRRALPLVDQAAFTSTAMKGLVRNQQELTSRYAGLGFMRFPAKESAYNDTSIPAGILSREQGTVQPYSPTGADFTSHLIRAALSKGVEPVMSSANVHGQAEIIERHAARVFAERATYPMVILDRHASENASEKPKGSYPILTAQPDHIEITRSGCFSSELLMRCFEGYDIRLAPENLLVESHYPEHVFGVEDLPSNYRDLSGPALRSGMLATIGWQSMQTN